jgi:hypothetical protein
MDRFCYLYDHLQDRLRTPSNSLFNFLDATMKHKGPSSVYSHLDREAHVVCRIGFSTVFENQR